MKLTGELKDKVEQTKDLEEAKAVIAEAGMLLSDDEASAVAGGVVSGGTIVGAVSGGTIVGVVSGGTMASNSVSDGTIAGGVMRGFKCKTCEKWFAHASEYTSHILETGHQA